MINTASKERIPRILLIALFLLSTASLAFEINITRIFSVTQFYHFAFLIVSLALLGYGASGAFLAIFPKFGEQNIHLIITQISLLNAISIIFSFLITNHLPFDSFSITLGWKYIGILLLHMVVLSLPFFLSGLVVIILINSYPDQLNLAYAMNLSGSSFGCLVAMFIPVYLGAVGLVVTCTIFCLLATILLVVHKYLQKQFSNRLLLAGIFSVVLLSFCAADLFSRLYSGASWELMKLNISPYKGISHILQYPDAEIIYQEWNAYSRVDLIFSDSIRSLPGYSYLSQELPPEQNGLFIDGDELSPVIRQNIHNNITGYLPTSIAYNLRPEAKVLILEPRGGLEVIIAKEQGAEIIHTSEPNPLIVEAAHNTYAIEGLVNYSQTGRSLLKRSSYVYDVIVISLNSSFHPVRSGAYGLGEDYRYTIEAFQDAMLRLDDDGLLVLTRWLQTPPSEFLRAFGIGVEAIIESGGDPATQIAAFRSYNTGTILLKKSALDAYEVDRIKSFTTRLAYDLVYIPGITEEEVNQRNILPEPYYFDAFTSLLKAESRDDWHKEYPYNVEPPSDDRPFFNQYFKWSQMPQVIAEFGKVWQPFGGAGFLILIILLMLSILLSLIFILVPTVVSIQAETFRKRDIWLLIYFAAIGLAYLFLEIPLIQQFILFLDNPSYSLTIVLFSILLFSGLGSRFSGHLSLQRAFFGLLFAILFIIILLGFVINTGLGLPLFLRIILTILLLSPLGFFMGVPFPKAAALLTGKRKYLIPWAWAINGTFSVVASVAAALLALSFGFRFVYILGSVIYFAAWMLIRDQDIQNPHPLL